MFKKYLKKAAKKYVKKAIAKTPGRKRMVRRRPKMVVKRYRAIAGGISNSTWIYGRRRLPKQVQALRRVGAPDIWQDNYSETVACQQGLQKYISFGSIFQSQLASLNAIAGNQQAPNRVLLESSQTEMTFTNVSNAAVEVELYDIRFKRDIPSTTNVAIGTNTYIFNSTPENMISQGAKAAASLPSASLTDPSEFRGSTPFDSQFFKDNCRVLQKSVVMLASGASHRHVTNAKHNRVASQTTVGNSSFNYLKDFSYTTLLCIRGLPVGIVEQDETTLSQATLNIVTSLRIKWTFVQDVTSNLVYNNVLPLTGQTQVRNIGSGALESVTP